MIYGSISANNISNFVRFVRRHPKSSFVINETHYCDNGENLLIDPMKKFLLTGAIRHRRIARTSLVKGFKLETVPGTIKNCH